MVWQKQAAAQTLIEIKASMFHALQTIFFFNTHCKRSGFQIMLENVMIDDENKIK